MMGNTMQAASARACGDMRVNLCALILMSSSNNKDGLRRSEISPL
jgi:hypothetical protein